MTQPAFDDRIVRLTIETDSGFKTFEGLKITASGVKMMTGQLAECQITIYNLTRELRDYLVTQTSPYRLEVKPKRVTLEVGRKSYGVFTLFSGEVMAANPTQSPDIGITFHALTGMAGLGAIYSTSQPASTPLKKIVKDGANAIPPPPTPAQLEGAVDGVPAGIPLTFEGANPNIGNHAYAGTATGHLQDLSKTLPDKDIYRDNDELVVKDKGKPLAGDAVLINKTTGMIGVPELITCSGAAGTPYGVRVRFLINNAVRLGGAVKIESDINPAANGNFQILRLAFHVDNRETPFYYIADCSGYVL